MSGEVGDARKRMTAAGMLGKMTDPYRNTAHPEFVAHDHAEFVEGCFRCDLSRDEQLTEASAAPETGAVEGHRYHVVDGLGGQWLCETTTKYPEPTPIALVDDLLREAAALQAGGDREGLSEAVTVESLRPLLANAVCLCGHNAEWHSGLAGCNAEDWDQPACDCRNDWLDAVTGVLFGILRTHAAARTAPRNTQAGPSERLCSQCGERMAVMVKVGTQDGWCEVCLDEASAGERDTQAEELAERVKAPAERYNSAASMLGTASDRQRAKRAVYLRVRDDLTALSASPTETAVEEA